MTQLEIEYFFPLTEQISLDLDYTPCKEFEEEKRKKWLSQTMTVPFNSDGVWTSTVNTATTFQFKPNPECVGHWNIGDGSVQVWREKRPNWLHQKMTKVFFGWEWKDK